MIFVKEKLRESCTKVCDYEEFKNGIIVWLSLLYVEELHILRLDFIDTIFMYLGYTNASVLDTDSYYHIVTSNKGDYNKVLNLIHSNLLKDYVKIKDKTLINYMEELYPELEGNVKSNFNDKLDILSNFNDKLNTFDKAVDYNWKYFNVSEREELVKYALGIDYHRDDEILSNKTYNEIRGRFKNRENNTKLDSIHMNMEIDYQTLGKIIKDSSERIYNNLNKDYAEHNKLFEQEFLQLVKEGNKDNMKELSSKKKLSEGRIKFCGSIPESLNKYLNYAFKVESTKVEDDGILITINCYKVKYLDKLERIFDTLYSHDAEVCHKGKMYLLRCLKDINYDLLCTGKDGLVTMSISFLFDNVENIEIEKEGNKMIDLDMIEQKRREKAHILTPKIESIYANKKKRTIVVKWQTGETTKVTCHESDKWDLEKGIMACITKYVLGNNYNAYSMLDKYIKSVKYSDNK